MAETKRTVFASTASFDPADRIDLLIQALAQLDESVDLTILCEAAPPPALLKLVTAYGLEGRVEFLSQPSSAPTGAVVFPSAANARSAPLRSAGEGMDTLVLDADVAEPWAGADPAAAEAPGAAPVMTVVRTMGELVGRLTEPGDRPAPLHGDPGALSGERIAIVTNYPTHYRVPLLNAVHRRLQGAGVPVKVFFTDPDPSSRTWMRPERFEFAHEMVPTSRVPRLGGRSDRDLAERVAAFEPSIVLAGGFSPTTTGRLARLARRSGAAFGVWSADIPSAARARGRVRRVQRKMLLRDADFGVAYGYLAGEYLRGLAPGLPFVYGRNTPPLPSPRPRADGGPVEVLAVSRAVRRKRLDKLIDAFSLLEGTARLTIAGGGEELEDLRSRVRDPSRVRLLGEVPSDTVGRLFEDADIFAFPSEDDPFGLVLPEAFAAGLAVICSPAPGATGDLAVPGSNCLVAGDDSVEGWARGLARLIDDPELRRGLGQRASETIASRWTMEHSADAQICGLRLGSLCRRS